MIKYRDFIMELERFVKEAAELRDAHDMNQNKEFRKWRHDLEGVINQIVQVGYLLPTPVQIKNRGYGYMPGYHDPEEYFATYQMEIDDTTNELTFIIDSYRKHGEPPISRLVKDKDKKDQEWPSKITLSWLFHNAPISLWAWFVGILVASFILGTQIAHTEFYKEIKAKLEITDKK